MKPIRPFIVRLALLLAAASQGLAPHRLPAGPWVPAAAAALRQAMGPDNTA
ncbi:MAG: hypothetical protein U1F56_10925 [Rubrivivax sp.]